MNDPDATVLIGGWRGPGWRVVDADPLHGKQVRDWIRSVITRHECPIDPADTALAVSELYANAVMHGPVGSRVLAAYCLWSSGARIVVCDGGGGPATPQLRQGIGLAEGGRGLQVIDSVAARWGSFRLSGSQVVWCDFGQPPRALTGDAWAWLHRVLSVCTLSPPARPGQPPQGRSPGPLTVPGLDRRAPVLAPVEATRRPRGSAPPGPARPTRTRGRPTGNPDERQTYRELDGQVSCVNSMAASTPW